MYRLTEAISRGICVPFQTRLMYREVRYVEVAFVVGGASASTVGIVVLSSAHWLNAFLPRH